MPDRGPRRRPFVPVLLAGVLGAGLVAWAGAQPWFEVRAAGTDRDSAFAIAGVAALGAGEMPLALALGLAVLACWGVLLVTRGRVRRAVALLGAVGGVALAATTVVGALTLPGQLSDAVREQTMIAGSDVATTPTPWLWLAAVGAVVSLVATVLAATWCPAWPEMGSRYDAPGPAGEPVAVPPEEQTNLDLWKQLDEGRDPTV